MEGYGSVILQIWTPFGWTTPAPLKLNLGARAPPNRPSTSDSNIINPCFFQLLHNHHRHLRHVRYVAHVLLPSLMTEAARRFFHAMLMPNYDHTTNTDGFPTTVSYIAIRWTEINPSCS
uniref:Uncharacterized protein n=1 Tax=Oryza nivara TaxID=4536 RepID=A0A0E0HYI3_ORYNI